MDIRKLQRAIVDGLEDVKAQNIAVFNTEHLSPLFERVIIASGTSNRQTKALASSVRESVKAGGFAVLRTEGEDNGEWIIVDCGAAVVHVMQPSIREYYHLEEIWGDKPVKMKLDGGRKPAVASAQDDDAPAAPRAARKTAAGKTSAAKSATANTAAGKTATTRTAGAKAAAGKTAAKKAAPSPAVKKAAPSRKTAAAAPAPAARKSAAAKAPRPAARAPARTGAAKAPSRKVGSKTTVTKLVVNAPAKKSAARKTATGGAARPGVTRTTGVKSAPARKTTRKPAGRA